MTEYKRPGGPLKGKPVQGLDGRWYDPFGEEIKFDPKDVEYSNRFWSRNQLPGLQEIMMEIIINETEKHGTLGSFVDPSGITERDREKLSAYRVLARQMGYKIAQYKFDAHAFIAISPIKKADYMP